MPEGPSIVILKEAVQAFKSEIVLDVIGNTKLDKERLINQKIIDFKSWGKHFLICFQKFTVRIHFMLFGSYRINEHKASAPRLGLQFKKGELNFYACSIQFIEDNLNDIYDWSADVMNDTWSTKKAKDKLTNHPKLLVCDALLDQQIFSGVGNIIKNEVLFRIKVHPESLIGDLPGKKLNELIKEAHNYSFEFYECKKIFVLKKHWLVHTKKNCSNCNALLTKAYLGKANRRTFYCEKCQMKY